MPEKRYIVHVDMDAFFAAIEQRDNPRYRSKPVVVGADPGGGRGRGVVSTCSYEARRFGIRSAMPISEAYRRCPSAVFLPVNMEKYSAVSSQIYEILYSFTPDIEPAGIDEAFLDITGSWHLFGTPSNTCVLIKSRIRTMTGLTASVGLAPTKMAAKIASDLKKPDGFVEVPQEGLLDFLRPLETRRLWGLGPKTAAALAGIGVNTIGDLAGRDPAEMERMFGANGLHLLRLANGIDDRGVVTEGEAKSISNEHTFGTDTRDGARLESTMMRLSEKVSARLRAGGLQCRTVTLKIRLKGFRTYTRSATMRSATNFADILYKEAKGLYNDFLRGAGFGVPIRLVGIKAHNLSSAAGSGDLFTGEGDRKMERLYGAIDRIRGRFGEGCICHAAGIPRKKHEKPEQA